MIINKIQRYLSENNIDAFYVTAPSNLFYVTNFTGTHGVALILRNSTYFITDSRYIIQAENEVKSRGMKIIDQGKMSFHQIVNDIITEEKVTSVAVESDFITYNEFTTLQSKIEKQLVPVQNVIESLRTIKQDAEVELIKKAIEVAEKTFQDVIQFVKVGMTEKEVSNFVLTRILEHGGTGTSFTTIVASGERGALPHGVASEKKINKNELVTLDFGAYFDGYVSDMTRTFSMGDNVDKRLLNVYQVVKEAKELAIQAIKPGVTTFEIDAIARNYICQKGYGDYFTHGTGHGIGIDIHEAPSVSYKSNETLEVGMVITVEPGIYIEGLGGVRIEDDILVTNEGYENLMKITSELITISTN